jgi:WS/DGAT/MGAT family acyltransferase
MEATSTAALDRLSREDARILKLGKGSIRGHTCKVLILERSGGRDLPTLEALREHIAGRLDLVPRFRQRLMSTPLRLANPVWVDDAHFDIERHVTRVPGDGVVDRAELDRIVARLMAEPLDRAHPLWHIGVVERLEQDSMALIWRVHHCLADGTTCVRIGSAILWGDAPEPSPRAWEPDPPPSGARLLASGLADRVNVRGGHRPRPLSSLGSLPRAGRVAGRELRGGAARTPLATRVATGRSVAFARVPLEECKQAGKAIADSVTVNDVVLSMIAGGVRSWLEQGGGDQRSPVRVKVPVSLHDPGKDDGRANHDSFFFVDLPVGEPDPSKRVLAISRETRERKLEHDAETLYHLGTNPVVAHWAMSPRVFTFNVSNVRGPAEEVFVLGARVRELYSLAEIAQHHALRVAVMSLGGSLFFGFCATEEHSETVRVLADGVRGASDELLRVDGDR